MKSENSLKEQLLAWDIENAGIANTKVIIVEIIVVCK